MTMKVTPSYKTYEEATKALNKMTLDIFCPIIKTTCRADCICYVTPYIKQVSKKIFQIKKPGCTHVLIDGMIYTKTG